MSGVNQVIQCPLVTKLKKYVQWKCLKASVWYILEKASEHVTSLLDY